VTTLTGALEQMLAAGMPTPPHGQVVADGRFHRYGPKKRCWYKLHEFIGRTGRQYISGTFGYWGLIDAMKIERDESGADAGELEELRRSMAEREAREAAKRAGAREVRRAARPLAVECGARGAEGRRALSLPGEEGRRAR
jgi:putative DNA primase/helicase